MPTQTVKATLSIGDKSDGKSLSGVYISGQDYLCLSLNAVDAKASDAVKSSGSFILILRRQR